MSEQLPVKGYLWRQPDGTETLIDPAEVRIVFDIDPGYDLVKVPAVLSKLYVLAVIDELHQALAAVRTKYVGDLSGDRPFQLLLKAEEYARKAGLDQAGRKRPR